MTKPNQMEVHQVQTIRVLIVEDHAVVSAGLSMILESNAQLSVVGTAHDRDSALQAAEQTRPNIILLDIALGDENSLDFLPQLLHTAPGARVIILTGSRDSQVHFQAISMGAMGVVLKQHASELLLKAISRVHAGEAWVDRNMFASVLAHINQAQQPDPVNPADAKIAALTERERQVIALIGEGLKNRQIAARLFITETTVRHHLTSVFSKLEVSDRLELVIYAYRHNLVERPQDSPDTPKTVS